MTETIDYHGHSIEVRTSRVGKKWTWEYTIDGRHYKSNSEETAPTESWAIIEAKAHAQGVIDRMP